MKVESKENETNANENAEKRDILGELEQLKKKHRKEFSEIDFDYEDLDEFGQEISDIIGLDNYKKISKYFAGGNRYWPQYTTLIERKRKEYVYNMFLEFGYSKTATILGISVSTVRRYVRDFKRRLRKKSKEEEL